MVICTCFTSCKKNVDRERVRDVITKANLQQLAAVVTQFKMDTGRLPTEKEGLTALVKQPTNVTGWPTGGYLETTDEVPLDGWGNEFVYKLQLLDGNSFMITSYGADGKIGGEGYDADVAVIGPN